MSKDDSVREADALKFAEIQSSPGSSGRLLLGGEPKYKRKRSYWRALKRGEVWAVMCYATRKMISDLNATFFGTPALEPLAPDGIVYYVRKYE